MMLRFLLLLGPIAFADALKIARSRRWYVLRVVLGLLLLFIVWQTYDTPLYYRPAGMPHVYSHAELTAIASRLIMQLMIFQGFAICFLAPALTAGAIAEEKQRKTLHYLLTSQMTSFEIVVGKLISRFFILALPALISLPVMVILGLLGGVEPVVVLATYGAIFSTALFMASLAIYMSTISRSGRDALFSTFVFTIIWLIGPWLLESILLGSRSPWPERYRIWFEPVNRHLMFTSPIFLVSPGGPMIGRGAFMGPWGWFWALATMVGHQAVGSFLCLLLAIVRLRPVFRRQDGAPATSRIRVVRAIRGKIRRWLPRKPPGEDAMLWKETIAMPGAFGLHLVSYVTMIVAAFFAYEPLKEQIIPAFKELTFRGYGDVTGYARQQLAMSLRVLNTGFVSIALLLLSALSATSICREREEDTWISLVSTPLNGWEILRAKLIGSIWGIRALIIGVAAVWLFGMLIGSFHPLGVLVSALQLAIFIAFTLAAGMLISLRVKTTMRAMTVILGLQFALALGSPILLSSMYRFTSRNLPGITCIPYLFACGMFTPAEFRFMLTGESHGGVYLGDGRDAVAIIIFGTLTFLIVGTTFVAMLDKGFDKLLDRPRRAGVIGPQYLGVFKAEADLAADEPAASPANQV